MLIASHNLMFGQHLDKLCTAYRTLRDREGLTLLCVQENEQGPAGDHADRIAAALGPGFRAVCDPDRPQLGMVYDGRVLELLDCDCVDLPNSSRATRLDRLYLRGGVIEPRAAQVAAFRARSGGQRFGAINFHLQTAGVGRDGTRMRRAQIQAIADALRQRSLADRIVACGDTNAFWWRPSHQLVALRYILQPLRELGALDPETAATHYFARQGEAQLSHRIAAGLGKLGLDLPMRYDVVCTNLPVTGRGQYATLGSDHDLVWAAIEPAAH